MSLEMERDSVTETYLEPRDQRKLDTVTTLIEGLYHDHSGDHAAVIEHHAIITQQYSLTNEQWTKALYEANQRYYDNQGYSPAGRASDAARMDKGGESLRRPEQTPFQTAPDTPAEVRTASLNWLEQESARIREASELSVPTAEVELAEAYWSGRRDSFNEAREYMLQANAGLEKDLPAAIEVDEIRVRQKIEVQDQTQGMEL